MRSTRKLGEAEALFKTDVRGWAGYVIIGIVSMVVIGRHRSSRGCSRAEAHQHGVSTDRGAWSCESEALWCGKLQMSVGAMGCAVVRRGYRVSSRGGATRDLEGGSAKTRDLPPPAGTRYEVRRKRIYACFRKARRLVRLSCPHPPQRWVPVGITWPTCAPCSTTTIKGRPSLRHRSTISVCHLAEVSHTAQSARSAKKSILQLGSTLGPRKSPFATLSDRPNPR